MKKSLLQARGLTRHEPRNDRLLLDQVELDVNGGDRIALEGPSGSGKSLLLRALSRLDPLDGGTVSWHETSISAMAVPRFRGHVMYFPQRAVLLEGTVESNLQRPFELQLHHNASYQRDLVLRYLARCQRGESFLAQRSRDLSGGEAQLVALIRGLQLCPDVLLLDEPTAALDSRTVRQIEQLLVDWFAEAPSERAWVWVTHDQTQASRIANRRLTIIQGRLHESHGTTEGST